MKSLKVWPEYFQEIYRDNKLFEVRQGSFEVGDVISLEEWNPDTKEYTEAPNIPIEITFVLPLTSGGLGDNNVLPFPVDPALPVCVFGFVKL